MNVFLKFDRPFAELVDYLGQLFGARPPVLSNGDGIRCVVVCLNVEIVAFDNHGLEDDCGIPFESYDVEIDILRLRSGVPTMVHQELVSAIATYLASAMSRHFQCEARIVRNLQKSLAVYVEGTLHDPGLI